MTATPLPPLLRGSGLRKTYGRKIAVDIDGIDLREGELLAAFGPNGAGKSTLLRLLAMLEKPDAGGVEFRGESGRKGERALRRASAVVFQRPHFWRDTVKYNVGLGLKLRGVPRSESEDRVSRVCDQLHISHLLGAHVSELSGGEAQRVGLARALVLDPEVLFLDEPTANLDTDSKLDLRQDIERAVRSRATSVFLITHDRTEAFHLADRVAMIRDGRLIQTDTPKDLYENPVDVYTARVTGAEFTIPGVVTGTSGRMVKVDIGGASLAALGSAALGERVKIAYRPEDLILALMDGLVRGDGEGNADRAPGTGGLSTRNRLSAVVTERRDMGGLVRLRMQGPVELVAIVTLDAAEELAVAPGAKLVVMAKATALHAFPSGWHGAGRG